VASCALPDVLSPPARERACYFGYFRNFGYFGAGARAFWEFAKIRC
jgi:hypothetical protein